MALELWLNYKDEKGEDKRVLVEGEKFVIGRTSDNDLQIPLSNLSRQHSQIQRFADVFVISDCGSSNGSVLNGEKLENPVGLKNGDKLNLGEAVEIEIEFVSDKPEAKGAGGDGGGSAGTDDEDENGEAAASSSSSASAKSASASASDKGGIPLGFFIIAPILGIFVLLVIGGIVLLARGTKKPVDIVTNGNKYTSTTPDDNNEIGSPPDRDNKTPVKSETPTPTPVDNSNNSNSDGNGISPPPTVTTEPTDTTEPTEEPPSTPKPTNDAEKIYSASASFLRRLTQNDTRAFLTDKQIGLVNSKIGQFKGSGALAENIRNAKKNASQITEIANSKSLKPQLLANAALTKLGNQRGDIVATVREISDSLSNVNQAFGGDSADACLLIVAAHSGDTSGESLQTAAGVLGKNFQNVSPRTIRSVWFFKEKGKLTDAQFDFVLRYLAIGAITQNPKDFNVQAEALMF